MTDWNIFKIISYMAIVGLLNCRTALGQTPIEQEKLARVNQLYVEAVKERDTLKLAEAYYGFGKIANGMSQSQKAIGWFTKALGLYLKTGDFYKAGRVHHYLATIAFEGQNLSLGLTHLYEAEKLYIKAKSEQGLMMVYGGLGRVCYLDWSPRDPRLPPKDSSIVYLRKAERIAERIDPKALPELRHYIGNMMANNGDTLALGYLEGVLKKQQETYGFRVAMPPLHAMLDLARAYAMFGRFGRAEQLLNEAEADITKYYGDKLGLMAHLEREYVSLYAQKKDWEKAFGHLQKLKVYDEKFKIGELLKNPAEINKAIADAARLENEKVESALKDEVLRGQQTINYTVGGALVATLALSFVLHRLYKKNQRISKRNALLVHEQNHRVKNNLQVISSLLSLQAEALQDEHARQAVDESQLRIQAMSLLHRQLYDNLQMDSVDIQEFIHSLVESILSSFGLDVTFIDRIGIHSVQIDKAIFIGLLVNELLTNACKYAFRDHPAPVLEISLALVANDWILMVKDNGLTRVEPETWIHGNTFGNQLINMMVFQLDGSTHYQFDEGLVFTIQFPNRYP
jgi:two-component system, sensor histidine kinase PdtaS